MVLALTGRQPAGHIAWRDHRVLVSEHIDQVGSRFAGEDVAFEIALLLTVHRHADVDGPGRRSSGIAGRVLSNQLTCNQRQQRGGHRHGQHTGTWKNERGRHDFLSYRYARHARAAAILAGLPRKPRPVIATGSEGLTSPSSA